jgi:RNA polymerase sigma-70 factor, ECF subfamily
MKPPAPEPELIFHARTGNTEAIAELFRRNYASSVAVARGILRTPDDALDAVQSAYLAAFRNFRSFRGDAKFKTWITRIVMNECLMVLRAPTRRRSFVSLDDAKHDGTPPVVIDKTLTPEEMAQRAEARASVMEFAALLPPRLKDVFVLCDLSGLSVGETALQLGLKIPATKTRLFRARSRIRSHLKARSCAIRRVKRSR